MTRTNVAIACLATALSGCVAPEVCGDTLTGEQVSSSTLSGEQSFAEVAEEGTVRFGVTLRGLSELWPAEHPVRGATLSVLIRLAYVDATETGGAATQMPRFSVNLEDVEGDGTNFGYDTPSFPAATGVPYVIPLFAECYDDGDLNCCEYGSTECSFDVLLRYRRLDGDPFPPVTLGWEATARASIDTCPLSSDPELELEVEEP